MSAYFRTQGIVLKKEDRGEADRVFTVYTKDFGKVQVRAVSARKIASKLRGGLELFYCSEIGFVQGKTYKTITDAAAINRFSELRADMASMRVAFRIADIAQDIIKGQEKDERIWSILQETFWMLNRSNGYAGKRNLAAYYFLWNLLYCTGYAPSFERLKDRDKTTARLIQILLEQDARFVHTMAEGIRNEHVLRQISKEHLLKALGS